MSATLLREARPVDDLDFQAIPRGLGSANRASRMPDGDPIILTLCCSSCCRAFSAGNSCRSRHGDLWRGLEALYGPS